MAVRLGELALVLDQAGAAAGIDEPARARLAADAAVAIDDCVLAAVVGERDVAHRRAGGEADAAPRRLLGEEVLEDAAVELVARHREVAARADLGDGVDVAPAFRREEAEAELLQLRRLEVLLQPEHLAQVVRADLDRRLADLVRGDRHRVDAPLEDEDVEVGERCFSCSASVRPARPPPVMTTSWRSTTGEAVVGGKFACDRGADHDLPRRRVRRGLVSATERARARSDARQSGQRERAAGIAATPASATVAIGCSRSGSAPAIALPASERAAGERIGAARVVAARERPVERRQRALARARREHERAGEHARARGHRRERAGRLDVEGDQQHRPRVGLALARRLEQAGAEARVERGQRRARLVAAGRDRPVAGGGVVHGVVELGRRDQRRLARQRRAHVVVDGEVAVRRGEDRRQRRRVEARLAHRRRGDLERERDGVGRAPPLGRREELGRGPLRRRRQRLGLAAERGARGGPAGQRRRPEGDRLSMDSVPPSTCRAAAFARRSPALASAPKTRTQLLPPKPNELLSATRTGACSGVDADLRPARGVEDARVDRPRAQAVLDREQARRRLDDAGRAERVAGHALGRAGVRRRREAPRDQRRFDLVVLRARRAVQVDVVDGRRVDAGARERVVEGALGAEALGMRRRHVMRVARLAVAEQAQRPVAPPSRARAGRSRRPRRC